MSTCVLLVKTEDDPETVGEVVCRENKFQGEHQDDTMNWIMKGDEIVDEPDDRYIAAVEKMGDCVAFFEFDSELVYNFAKPLLKKYGFDNVKWFTDRDDTLILLLDEIREVKEMIQNGTS